MGERVSAVPDASPEAFAATVWDSGLEQASELAESVAILEAARAELQGRVADAAWSADVAPARQALVTHTGILKRLSGDYRRARALARSIVIDPKLSGPELVSLMDALLRGQAAAARIRDGDAFGKSAFGSDWRGERSSSAPLMALVEWMQTLRGLGSEPRLIAGRLAERSEAGARAERVRPRLVQGS